MAAAVVEKAMPRRSNDVSAKIDAEALRLARLAAEIKGVSVAEYISGVVSKHATSDIDAWAAARVEKKKAGPK